MREIDLETHIDRNGPLWVIRKMCREDLRSLNRCGCKAATWKQKVMQHQDAYYIHGLYRQKDTVLHARSTCCQSWRLTFNSLWQSMDLRTYNTITVTSTGLERRFGRLQCLLHKHEDLRSSPQSLHKNQAWPCVPITSTLQGRDREIPETHWSSHLDEILRFSERPSRE